MRVRIIFGLTNKGASVPFHHQFLLSNLIYAAIDRSGGKYKGFTDYTFSGLKGQTKVGKEGLQFFSNKVTLVVSSPDEGFIHELVKELFRMHQIELGKLLLVPLSVEKEADPKLTPETKYICISPLVVISPVNQQQEAKKFISPFMDEFSDLLYESTMARMEKSGYSAEQLQEFYKFQIIPDKNYIQKIKQEEKKFARIFPVFEKGEKYEVRGYTFPFVLYAREEVQKFIFHTGLGIFTYKGFGMVDVVNSDPNQRTTPFEF